MWPLSWLNSLLHVASREHKQTVGEGVRAVVLPTGCPHSMGLLACQGMVTNEPRHEKTNILVFDQVQHKLGCTVTEDGYRLEILDLESRGIVLSR